MTDPVLILGCGFTGTRVALMLRRRGVSVTATTRNPGRIASLQAAGVDVHPLDIEAEDAGRALSLRLPPRVRAVHSVPPRAGRTTDLLAALKDRIVKVVYISSTGVYGETREVDEHSVPAPVTARQRARRDAEIRVEALGIPSLVLRPPAIYGPGRGVHVRIREGTHRLVGDGGNVVSRIHVDDLARHVVAGLESGVVGAWPLSDARSATSIEVATWCAERLGVPVPIGVRPDQVSETLRTTRNVDGSAIRDRLRLALRFPTYREGIEAALAEESTGT